MRAGTGIHDRAATARRARPSEGHLCSTKLSGVRWSPRVPRLPSPPLPRPATRRPRSPRPRGRPSPSAPRPSPRRPRPRTPRSTPTPTWRRPGTPSTPAGRPSPPRRRPRRRPGQRQPPRPGATPRPVRRARSSARPWPPRPRATPRRWPGCCSTATAGAASSAAWTPCGPRSRTGTTRPPTARRVPTASPRRCPAPRWAAWLPTGRPTRPPRSSGACSTSRPRTARRARHGATPRPTAGTEPRTAALRPPGYAARVRRAAYPAETPREPRTAPPSGALVRPRAVARSARRWSRHRQDVEGLIELLLGDLAAVHVAALEDDLTDRAALGERLLGHRRGGLVAQVAVERRHDGGGALRQLQAPLRVGGDPVDAAVGQKHGGIGQQGQRLQDVAADDGQHDVELEAAAGPRRRDGGVVADHLGTHHEGGLGHDRVDLAGHDARPRLQVGQADLAQARPRTGAHPAQVVADLGEADGDDLGAAAEPDHGVLGGLGLEVVVGRAKRHVQVDGQLPDDPSGEPGGGI